jgi:hypothetical protein
MHVFTSVLFWSKVISMGVLLFLSGCATTYTLKVDAITNPETAETNPQSYIIVNKNPDVDESDLRYQETKEWVKTALSGKGLYEAPNVESADMIIELEYGMEEPYDRTTVVQDIHIERDPPSVRTIWIQPEPGAPPIPQTIVVQGHTRHIPIQRTIVQTIHEKYLKITAIKTPDDEAVDTKAEQLWSVHVTNEDTGDNLREYLPVMASAAINYIDEDSGTEKEVRIKEDDETVTFVKEGM